MFTEETKLKIIDQIDIIDHAKDRFEVLDMLMLMAAESGDKIDCTGEDIGKLGQFLKFVIADPIFEAAERIYKLVGEGAKS